MALNLLEEDEHTITIEREEKMVPPTGGDPFWRNAHFLKPLINPTNQSLPRPPSLSPSSDPIILKKITKRVDFKGRPKPPEKWKTWVRDLEQTHQNIWKKVGIFDAIKASTYKILRHNELIVVLAEKWCPKTCTFIFPWGECTVTLEDVMILGGFPVLGASVICYSESGEFEEIVTKLVTACSQIKAKCSQFVTHNGWMNYFKGKGGELEHVALLVLWLSRYVFSTNSLFRINQDVFDIAVRLAKGIKVALAPAVLAWIYRDLGLLKKYFSTFTCKRRGRSPGLVLLAPFQLVQLWAWERFPCLSPKPNSLMLGEPRLARWHGLRKIEIEGLRDELEAAGDHFLWKPYALNLKNWDFPKFYSDKERWVLVNSKVDDELLSFAICLRASELVAVDCLEQYCPHRVAMQFGMDQDIPNSLPRSLAWSSYNKPLDGWRFYLPHRLVEGDVTYQYSNWWKEAFPSDDHMLIVYKRKLSPRKVESLYHILTRSLGSDEDNRALVCFPPNEEPLALNFVWGRNEPMLIENLPSFETMQEIETVRDRDGSSMAENEALTGKEPQDVETKRLHDDDNRAPVCIPTNKEAMALDFVGRTELMLVKKPPSCETVQAVETLCDQNGSSMAENEALICKDPQVAEMKHLGDDGNKAPVFNKDAAALEVVEPRAELKLIEKPPSCEAKQENEVLRDQNGPSVAENEAHVGKDAQVDEMKQLAYCSIHGVVIIDDDIEKENDTDSVSQLKLRESELEARIKKLERVVSVLKRRHRL